MEVNVRPPKTLLRRHLDVISYHCVPKLTYFLEHDTDYQPSKFQCSRTSGSNFMEGEGGKPPLQCYNEINKLSAFRVEILFSNLKLYPITVQTWMDIKYTL